MRVVVYKNLNLGNWTIAEVSGRSGRGRKIAGVASIVLADVTFHVQPSAQAKEQRRLWSDAHGRFAGQRLCVRV